MGARYHVEFSRIGRTHNPPALETTAESADELAEKVLGHARSYLLSRDIEVTVDLASLTTFIFAGVQHAGSGTVIPFPAETAAGR